MTKPKTIGKGTVDFKQEFASSKATNAQMINNRKIINGDDDGLMQVYPLKHPEAMTIFKAQLANTWMPEEVEMTRDIEQWNKKGHLTDRERTLFKRCLAFASNLDGILTDSLVTNVSRHVTSPEVRLVLARQGFEEALHVLSYAVMIEALSMDSEEIYGMYRQDKVLYEKNRHVLESLGKIAHPDFKTGTFSGDQTFLEACVTYQILEGVYFFIVFLLFYILKRNNKMPGSAEMIQFINRDEDLHVRIFSFMINTIKKDQPELWTKEFQDKMASHFKSSAELEISWGIHCMGDGVLGLNPVNIRQYIEFIANTRMQAIGLPPAYKARANPFPWIDEMTQGSMIETNFFEGRVREYASGTLTWDE
ncbi:MAG: ribonucleotide-diphosphate reductase subunit beta [SAR324 cluster bacterium]|nr:ribonucleotide-diphosphate reductase subunit beta [SAR324 cluster bacterium]